MNAPTHSRRPSSRAPCDEAARGLRVQPDAQLRTGDPARELLGRLEETGAEMVVAGAHLRAAFEGTMTGTVRCRLTAAARCPVAVISPRAEASCEGAMVAGHDGSDHSQRAILVAAGLAVRLRTRRSRSSARCTAASRTSSSSGPRQPKGPA